MEKDAGSSSGHSYPLHRAVWENDLDSLKLQIKAMEAGMRDVLPGQDGPISVKDVHGNTAAHLAAMLNRKDCMRVLLANKIRLDAKNNGRWTALEEAICYNDAEMVEMILKYLKQQAMQKMESRTPEFLSKLEAIGAFYLELKWDFHSWVPFVSRLCPKDTFKIYKGKDGLRIDTTLREFGTSSMSWKRGDLTYLIKLKPARKTSKNPLGLKTELTMLDNEAKKYFKLEDQEGEDADEEVGGDDVNFIMSGDVTDVDVNVADIRFQRAYTLFGFGSERTETIGEKYQAGVYDIQNMKIITRIRTEHHVRGDSRNHERSARHWEEVHRSPHESPNRQIIEPPPPYDEDPGDDDEFHDAEDTDGHANGVNGLANDVVARNGHANPQSPTRSPRTSLDLPRELPPVPEPTWLFDDYLAADTGTDEGKRLAQPGRPQKIKVKSRTLTGQVFMSDDFPVDFDIVMGLLSVAAPNHRLLRRLNDFISTEMPPGFPVKLDMPIVPTITAALEFQNFEWLDEVEESIFKVPDEYELDSSTFPFLGQLENAV
eukprot:Clim_evm44s156 gene=Clim_evmTU44s156